MISRGYTRKRASSKKPKSSQYKTLEYYDIRDERGRRVLEHVAVGEGLFEERFWVGAVPSPKPPAPGKLIPSTEAGNWEWRMFKAATREQCDAFALHLIKKFGGILWQEEVKS